jgi:NAD(P)-dependent dehydrogenase (short-subunit alcohol dehydrogenase family)
VAAKHGVVGLTKVTALENATTGVTCNAICPGWVLTPLVQKQVDAKAAALGVSNDEATRRLLGEKEPSLQFTTPEELGALAVFFCSAAAATTCVVSPGTWTVAGRHSSKNTPHCLNFHSNQSMWVLG